MTKTFLWLGVTGLSKGILIYGFKIYLFLLVYSISLTKLCTCKLDV